MQSNPNQKEKLPFRCRALCLSLAGATVLLILDYFAYQWGYVSGLAAIWIAIAVFILATIYEAFLLSLVFKFMFQKLKAGSSSSKVGTPSHT